MMIGALFGGRSVKMDNGIVQYLCDKLFDGSSTGSSHGKHMLCCDDESKIIAKFVGSKESVERTCKTTDEGIEWILNMQQREEKQDPILLFFWFCIVFCCKSYQDKYSKCKIFVSFHPFHVPHPEHAGRMMLHTQPPRKVQM